MRSASSLRGLVGAHRLVGEHPLVGQRLDARQLVGAHRPVVAEVEAQAVGGDERAGLLHVGAEHLAQRPVQDVRAGVVAPDRLAPRRVDRRGRLLPRAQLALDDAHAVADEPGQRVGRVEHLGPPGVGGDRAGVADLAAALGVERRAVEERVGRRPDASTRALLSVSA